MKKVTPSHFFVTIFTILFICGFVQPNYDIDHICNHELKHTQF